MKIHLHCRLEPMHISLKLPKGWNPLYSVRDRWTTSPPVRYSNLLQKFMGRPNRRCCWLETPPTAGRNLDFYYPYCIGEISKVVFKKNCHAICPVKFKGTGHAFCWSGKPINHLQKQGNIHIFQNKLQNPHKFAEIMKKSMALVSFILEGTLTVFLIS